jgi:hypothetical protein
MSCITSFHIPREFNPERAYLDEKSWLVYHLRCASSSYKSSTYSAFRIGSTALACSSLDQVQTIIKGVAVLLIDQTAFGPSSWCYAVES